VLLQLIDPAGACAASRPLICDTMVMPILFLDIDGVLHEDVCRNPANLLRHRPRFEEVMRSFPTVEIVISSTWRESRTLDELRALFSKDVQRRIIGVTPHWSDVQDPFSSGAYVRQAEVLGWLIQAQRAWEPWVALDDKHYLFKPFLPNLVKCDPAQGLTDETANELRRKLSALVQ
jgi:hypothetical protein